MRLHHQRAIQRLVEHFASNDTCLGVIVGGSVAKGLDREDSDVDVMLVVTDEFYRERWEANQLLYFNLEFCDYPGGYIDGKYVTLDYLRAAVDRGNEITRAAFLGAYVAHSKIDGLDELVRRIPVFQPGEQREKIQAFYAQFEAAYWYLTEAVRRDDRYLLLRAASDLALYGCRLILERNEVLYPYHKHLVVELERAPDRPSDLPLLLDALVSAPGQETARAFYDAIKAFRNFNPAFEAWQTRYIKDSELAWLDGREYVGDR
jgi:predicted nucleotidyltransferase